MRTHIPVRSLDDRVRHMESPKLRPNTSSLDLTLEGTWVAFGSGHKTPGYFKTSDALVGLEGTISAGASTSLITTLPEGFRPDTIILFPVVANAAFAAIQVEPDGDVRHVGGSTTKLSLDVVRFKAAQ